MAKMSVSAEGWGTGATLKDVLEGYLIQVEEQVSDQLRNKLETVTRDAEHTMYNIVDAKRNEVTGALLRTVDSKVLQNDDTAFVSEIGYINNPVDYDVPNEFGFTHYKSGEWVEGIFAVRDTALFIEDELENFRIRGIDYP